MCAWPTWLRWSEGREAMCKELCEDYDGQTCQDCGKFVCFDVKSGDDLFRPAYVTEDGDLFCDRCGPAHDEDDHYDYADDVETYP